MTANVARQVKMNNGLSLPTVGLGTWAIPNRQTTNVVYEALKAGYRHFDCAVLYGNEREVGDGIMKWVSESSENKREDVTYVTKIWNSECGYVNAKNAIKQCLEQVHELGYIDLLLMHSPLCGPEKRLDTWQAMQEAVDEGDVKSIGVSNFGQHHIEQLLKWDGLKHKPVVNEIEISPWCMRSELAQFCQKNDILVEAYAPLSHGGKINESIITKIAKTKGVSNAQVLIRWSLQKGYIPLPKTQTVNRLASNLDVYDFELSPEEEKEIDHPQSYEPTDWECTDAP